MLQNSEKLIEIKKKNEKSYDKIKPDKIVEHLPLVLRKIANFVQKTLNLCLTIFSTHDLTFF